MSQDQTEDLVELADPELREIWQQALRARACALVNAGEYAEASEALGQLKQVEAAWATCQDQLSP